MATVFEGNRAAYYISDDTVYEMGTGRPVYYRGAYSDVFYAYAGGVPTFWIDVSQLDGNARLPLGGVRGYLHRFDRGTSLRFEEELLNEDDDGSEGT
jgi:hypothetical protein